jgi:hypothetical protein
MADISADAEVQMQNGQVEHVPFANILNFRDVGKTINAFLGEK